MLDAPARESIADAALAGDFAASPADLTTVAPHQADEKAEFVLLPLEAIAESPWNPRKHFDPKELAELTASVALDGVWEPVLVRPHRSGHGVFELASGHRRYRASKAAGRTHIPALVRELSDETFLKLLTIANLQREDVHPLEQADAFAVQMKEFGWKPDRIARECGRGETFVYDHLKFLQLIPAVRDLFFADRISTAHAVELTRLTPTQQQQAIDPETGGLWEGELLSHDMELALDESKDPYAGLKAKTFRELKAWIQSNLRFDAHAADPVLFESVTAVKRAAEAKLKIVSITWDDYPRDAVKRAEGAKLLTPTFWRRADGLDGTTPCEFSAKVLGVVESGPDQGAAYHVCLAREKCLVHWGDRIKAKAKAAKASAAGTGKSTAAKQSSAPREQPWEREQRERAAAQQAFKPGRAAVEAALVAKLVALSYKVGGPIDQILAQMLRVGAATVKRIPKVRSAEDHLRRAALDIVLRQNDYWAHVELPKLGKVLGVDVAAIVKAHAPTPAAKALPAPKGKAATKQAVKTAKKKGGKR